MPCRPVRLLRGNGAHVAQKVEIVRIDDLTGEEGGAVHTVRFDLDGVGYEMELSIRSETTLRDALQPFISCARRAPKREPKRKPARKKKK